MENLTCISVSTMASISNSTTCSDERVSSVVVDLLQRERRFLQPLWDLRLGYEDLLSSSVWVPILTVSFYFACCFPFFLLDVFCKNQKWYLKYKIQPDKEVTWPQIWDCLNLTFWNQLLVVMPGAAAQWVWTPPTQLPELAPPLWELVWQTVVCLLMFDFQYYVWHSTHHRVKFLYKHIHKVHHRYSSPFVWTSQYLHPWELVWVGCLNTSNAWFFNAHPLTIWCYMLTSIVISVENHIGFEFPFFLAYWDPTGILGGCAKHDMHHYKPKTNFAPFFNIFDKMFGTFCPLMGAGGYKSPELQEYERHAIECRKDI